MQQDGRHEPQAEQWPSFLGAPAAPAHPAQHHAPTASDGSGFRLPTPPQFASPPPTASPHSSLQFQYAPSPQSSPEYPTAAGHAPQDPAAADGMHQPTGHAANYAMHAQPQPQAPGQQPHAATHMSHPHQQAATPAHGGAFTHAGQAHYAQPHPSHAPTAHGQQPYQHGAAAVAMSPAEAPQTFVAADGRTYAYATPQGFDLMQDANSHASAAAVAATLPAPAPTGPRRMRWETIIPAAAAVLLLCTIGLFVLKFDAITGRDQTLNAATKTAEPKQATAPSKEDQAASLEQARSLADLGRYDEAKAMVDPLLAVQAPLDGVAALSSQIETSSARNDELLALLGKQRQAGSWMGVVTTIGQIKALRPLTKDLVTIRNAAQGRVNAAQRAKKRAKVTAATRRRAAAARTRAAARAAKRPSPRSTTRPGSTANTSAATPPARVGSGAMPPRPSVANTGSAPSSGGVTGGQPAVTGGGAGSCHTHEGVESCH